MVYIYSFELQVSFVESLKSHLSLFVSGDSDKPAEESKPGQRTQPVEAKISDESNSSEQV